MTEALEAVSSKRHGIFGRKIEYQTNLSLKEIEDRLHQTHDGRNPTSTDVVRPNAFSYLHPTTMVCEFLALQRVNRNIVLTLAKAKGKVVREGNSKITNVKFTVATGITGWIAMIACIPFLFLGLYLINNEEAIVGAIVSIVAIIGFMSFFSSFYKETQNFANLAEEIFL